MPDDTTENEMTQGVSPEDVPEDQMLLELLQEYDLRIAGLEEKVKALEEGHAKSSQETAMRFDQMGKDHATAMEGQKGEIRKMIYGA